ncbi:MAG: YigZ family protein [Anaerolineaceae bacterium 4572_78]|nr:MAG: YigZ family protein [Anaerolineaceae bacterium 4572_78]
MPNKYIIPDGIATIEIIIRRSRFISNAGYTSTIENAKAFIADAKTEHPTASHYVYAFAIGHGSSVTHGMSDAGEPSNTAGKPTLAVVKGSGLADITVVTTRYFGGTKLGKGGLIKAYTESAQIVLAELPRIEKIEKVTVKINVPYNLYERVKLAINHHGGKITVEDFGVSIMMIIDLPKSSLLLFEESISEMSSGRLHVYKIQ